MEDEVGSVYKNQSEVDKAVRLFRAEAQHFTEQLYRTHKIMLALLFCLKSDEPQELRVFKLQIGEIR